MGADVRISESVERNYSWFRHLKGGVGTGEFVQRIADYGKVLSMLPIIPCKT